MGEHVKVGLQVGAGIAAGFLLWRMFVKSAGASVLGAQSSL